MNADAWRKMSGPAPTSSAMPMAAAPQPLIEMHGISKKFGENPVLVDVDFVLHAGEVHALLGENGAGKSTLMKILMGVYDADAGDILLDGEPIRGRSIRDHLACGIAMIFQELSLVPNGTVAENLFLGREPQVRNLYVDRRAMRRRTEELIATFGFDLHPDALVGELPFAQRQIVEIMKAVSRGARVLIMDEPTSALTVYEETKLFETIASLKSRGIGLIYISHRMAEIFRVSDCISIVKDGRLIGPTRTADMTIADITAKMSKTGMANAIHASARSCSPSAPSAATLPPSSLRVAAAALETRGLRTQSKLAGIDLVIRPGEIVGIAGLVGSGRSTLGKALFGLLPDRAGEILIDGRPQPLRNPRAAIAAGIALVPEDRRLEGLVGQHGLAANIALPNLNRVRLHPLLPVASTARARQLFERFRDALSIVSTGHRQAAEELSGGNQQKVVFAKWLATEPKVLLLDEPTSGVDINAKADMRRFVRDAADRGVGVLLISSELDELILAADRILILAGGKLTGEVSPEIGEAALRARLQAETASITRTASS